MHGVADVHEDAGWMLQIRGHCMREQRQSAAVAYEILELSPSCAADWRVLARIHVT